MPARINEFSYDGAGGEFVEIRVPAGTSVSDLTLEIYGKSGPTAELDQTIDVSTGDFSTDGVYDYYVIEVSLEDGPRAAIALVQTDATTGDATVLESVTWGATSPVTIEGGSLDGTSQPSIGDPLKNNSTGTLNNDGNGGWTVAPPTPGEDNVCFTAGTIISTPAGGVAIEHLIPGMQVLTVGEDARTIRWVGRKQLGLSALRKVPKLRPIRILAGALGDGFPKRDLLVSRQHRILVRSRIAERMFGVPEVLVAAIRLTELPGVFIDDSVDAVEYVHLLFDQHEVILAEGTPTESLYTGPEALKAVGAAAREEILTIFPEVAALNYAPEPAAFIPSGRLQKKLVARHLENAQPVLG